MLSLRLETSQPCLQGSMAEIAYFSRNHVRFSALKELTPGQEVVFTHQPTYQLTISFTVKFSLKTARKTVKFVKFGYSEYCTYEDGQQRFTATIRHREVYSQSVLHVSYVRCDALLNTQAVVLRDEEKQFSVPLHYLERPIVPLVGDALTILITELKTGEHTLQLRVEKLEPGIHVLAAGYLLLLLVLQREAYKRPYDVAFALKMNEFALKSIPARIECSKLKNNRYYCKLPGPNDNELFLGHQCIDKHTELFVCESVQQACDQSTLLTTVAGKNADPGIKAYVLTQLNVPQTDKTPQFFEEKQVSDDLLQDDYKRRLTISAETASVVEIYPELQISQHPEQLPFKQPDHPTEQYDVNYAALHEVQGPNSTTDEHVSERVAGRPAVLVPDTYYLFQEQDKLCQHPRELEKEHYQTPSIGGKQRLEEPNIEKSQQQEVTGVNLQKVKTKQQSSIAAYYDCPTPYLDEQPCVYHTSKGLSHRAAENSAEAKKYLSEQRAGSDTVNLYYDSAVEISLKRECKRSDDNDTASGSLEPCTPFDEVEYYPSALRGPKRESGAHLKKRQAVVDQEAYLAGSYQASGDIHAKLYAYQSSKLKRCENRDADSHFAAAYFQGKRYNSESHAGMHVSERKDSLRKPAKAQIPSYQMQSPPTKPSRRSKAAEAQTFPVQASGLRLTNGKYEYCAALPELHMRDLITRVPTTRKYLSIDDELDFQPPLRNIYVDGMQASNHAIRLPNGASVYVDCTGERPVVIMYVYGLKDGVLRAERTVLKDWVAVKSGDDLVPRPKACLMARPPQDEEKQKCLISNLAPLLNRSPALQSQAASTPEHYPRYQKTTRMQQKHEDTGQVEEAALIVQTPYRELEEEQQALWAEVRKVKSSLKYQDALPGLRFSYKYMTLSLSGQRKGDSGFVEDRK